jgi:oligopeptide transport system substrate-binding protein
MSVLTRILLAASLLLLLGALGWVLLPGLPLEKRQRADVVIINGSEPESLDPAIVTLQADLRLARALFEGLVRLNARTAEPEPGLAERWTVSPDGKTYTFYLRSNALWSTGEAITADDVVYSWLRVLDPRTASDYAGQLFFVKHAEEFCTGKLTDSSQVGVHALDRRTVQVELRDPTPFFLDLCTFPTLAVVPRQAIEQHGDRWITARPLPVSGPFTLDSWRLRDRIRVRRNPHYWDAARTQSEVVDFLTIDSAMTALNLYQAGEADIIWDKPLIPSELMDVLGKRRDCHTFNYLGSFFLRFNVTRPPFNDARVRRALALAIDKQRIVERITRAGEKPASHFTPDGIARYDPPEGLGHDPEAARRLLAEAGYPGGRGFRTFRFLLPNVTIDQQIAVELQAMWRKELGLTVELRQNEMKVFQAAQTALDYDVSRSSWIGDYNDANTFLELFMSHNGNNRTGWQNARYDMLMRSANAELDVTRRAELLRQAETVLVREELPIVPIYFYAGINFFDPDKIEGVTFNVLDEHPIQTIRRKALKRKMVEGLHRVRQLRRS